MKHKKRHKFRKRRGFRMAHAVSSSSYCHGSKHPGDIAVHVRNELKYYSITSWLPIIDQLVSQYSGRGISDDLLVLRARGAIQTLVQGHINAGTLGRIPAIHVARAIRDRLDQEIRQHAWTLQSAREREEILRALAWKSYLARNQPEENELQRRYREYLRGRGNLVKTTSPYELPNSFTSAKRQGVRIRVGLDFGTTGIKAAYRTEDQGDDRTIPLRLNDQAGIDGFVMVPSLRIQNGNLVFSDQRSISDMSLKRCLSCTHGGGLGCGLGVNQCPLKKQVEQLPQFSSKPLAEASAFLASVFLGFVFDRVRRAILEDVSKRFQETECRSFIHMCVPVGELENPLCNAAFQDTLTIADQMFHYDLFRRDSVSGDEAFKRWNDCRALGIVNSNAKRRSRVFPEVIAEIASFAMSKSAAPGVYGLIDVGAGTIDVNIFRWVQPSSSGGARTPVFAAYCDGTGVLALEEHLLEVMDGQRSRAIELFQSQKRKGCFPHTEELSNLFPPESQVRVSRELKNAVADFSDAIARNSKRAWGQALVKRGKETDWNKLGVFIGGGGSAVRQVREGLHQGMQNDFLRLEVRKLPAPDPEDMERVPGLPLEEFHRIAVAYGLTVADHFEGGLIWPKDIKPMRTDPTGSIPAPKYADRFISKEMV